MTEQEKQDLSKAVADKYGIDAKEWLRRWDNDETVWTISMGGLGDGYEHAIQSTVAENLRFMISKGFDSDKWEDKEIWQKDYKLIEESAFKNSVINELGITGAQFGAAINLSAMLYSKTPIGVMSDARVKDRHIQVSRKLLAKD